MTPLDLRWQRSSRQRDQPGQKPRGEHGTCHTPKTEQGLGKPRCGARELSQGQSGGLECCSRALRSTLRQREPLQVLEQKRGV